MSTAQAIDSAIVETAVQPLPSAPEWKRRNPPPSRPEPIEEELTLTRAVWVTLNHEQYGHGSLHVWMSLGEKTRSLEEDREAVLRFVLAETKAALPVLEAMVQKLDEARE